MATHQPDGAVKVEYFTDPLCCWSWAMEPHLDQILQAHGPQIKITHYLVGLIESWQHYSDDLNAVFTPTQMGPLWVYAAETARVEIDASIWVNDPPSSSYPACQAIKCLQLQDGQVAVNFLKKLRSAVMIRKRNIAKNEVLMELAMELFMEEKNFDLQRFTNDMEHNNGRELFLNDLAHKQQNGVIRLPTLLLHRGHSTIRLTGYRSMEILAEAVKYMMNLPAEHKQSQTTLNEKT